MKPALLLLPLLMGATVYTEPPVQSGQCECVSIECLTCIAMWPSFDTGELSYCESRGFSYAWTSQGWAL